MDTSLWTSINPDIRFKSVNKIMYKEFLYKIVIFCPLVRILKNNKFITLTFLERYIKFRSLYQNPKKCFSSYNTRQMALSLADANQLLNISKVIKDHHHRIEGHRLSIYARDEKELRKIIEQVDKKWHSRIIEIHGPKNEDETKKLSNNTILLKKCNYKYKVTLKSGFYQVVDAKSIINLIDTAGGHVPPKWKERSMTTKSDKIYLQGKYFYLDDTKIISFIEVIKPGIIDKIYSVELKE